MSTNAKNKVRPEFLKNFTTKIKESVILINKSPYYSNVTDHIFKINRDANKLIQELNLKIEDRQLPYINLRPRCSIDLDSRSRVFVRDFDTSNRIEKKIVSEIEKHDDISHFLDLLIAPGYKEIKISNLSCDAKLIIDAAYFECAIIDILLDIIMFNSYSFLKNMDINEKKKFSHKKFNYFQKHKLECFYDCVYDESLYYSLAFSARSDMYTFDIEKYIMIWNDFINEYYAKFAHKEKSIKDQLKQHVDYHELSPSLPKSFSKKNKGAYLLLRTNKDKSEKLHPFLLNYFHINEYRKGKIKIIPISEFDICEPLLKNLDVSAFKVVKK